MLVLRTRLEATQRETCSESESMAVAGSHADHCGCMQGSLWKDSERHVQAAMAAMRRRRPVARWAMRTL